MRFIDVDNLKNPYFRYNKNHATHLITKCYMKSFEFFKYKKAQIEDEEPPIASDSGDDIFDKIQQEFISRATSNAERIVRAFNSKYDGAFDYSIRSLNVLDSLIEDFCAQAGSYVLEVARRSYGGIYFWEGNLQQPMLKTELPNFEVSILTFEKVKNRIINGDEDNIPYFFKGYSERIHKTEKGDSVTFV